MPTESRKTVFVFCMRTNAKLSTLRSVSCVNRVSECTGHHDTFLINCAVYLVFLIWRCRMRVCVRACAYERERERERERGKKATMAV